VTFLLSCPVLVTLFFSDSLPGRTPGRTLTIYGLNNASSPKNVPFGGWMTTHNFKGFKHPKTPRKRGRGFEPHSWLCGWSRITKFKLKMADDHHIAKCWKLAYQWTDLDETWAVAFHHVPDMSALMRLPRQRPLPSNDALKIQHLCGSGGRSRKTQHRIKAAMTVTWSNIKIF